MQSRQAPVKLALITILAATLWHSTHGQDFCSAPVPLCNPSRDACCTTNCTVIPRSANFNCGDDCSFSTCNGVALDCPRLPRIKANGEPCTTCSRPPCGCTFVGSCVGQPSKAQFYLIVLLVIFIVICIACTVCHCVKGCMDKRKKVREGSIGS